MSAVDDEPAFAKAVREDRLHLQRLRVRHGIEVRVQPWNEPFAEASDNAGGLHPLLVILEALLRGEARHADVIGGLAVAARVAEIDDVHRMMEAGPNKARPTSQGARPTS
jgi:hypothetical protein